MLTSFRLFQYTQLFLRQQFLRGQITEAAFVKRLTSLGYLPSEIRMEISSINDEKESTNNGHK